MGAEIFNSPEILFFRASNEACINSTSFKICLHHAKYSAPSSVKEILRVVRLTNRIPKLSSKDANNLATEDGELLRSSAAFERLPCSIMHAKDFIALN